MEIITVTENVAVFLDFQNVQLVGHQLFGGGCEAYRCVPNPSQVADLVAGYRRRPSVATAIRVYRGQPNPVHQRKPAAANEAQAWEWTKDRRVEVIRRPLNYRGWPDRSPQEKGIDVALAVDLILFALRRRHDALVLFSSDSDLLAALEAIVQLRLGHVEVACWTGSKPLRFPESNPALPYCHFLGRADWATVIDDWKGRV